MDANGTVQKNMDRVYNEIDAQPEIRDKFRLAMRDSGLARE
jgi:hypothetical protein